LAAAGAGIVAGINSAAMTDYFASILSMAAGQMGPEDLSREGFALGLGLGALFGGIGGRYCNPATDWRIIPGMGRNARHRVRVGAEVRPHGGVPRVRQGSCGARG